MHLARALSGEQWPCGRGIGIGSRLVSTLACFWPQYRLMLLDLLGHCLVSIDLAKAASSHDWLLSDLFLGTMQCYALDLLDYSIRSTPLKKSVLCSQLLKVASCCKSRPYGSSKAHVFVPYFNFLYFLRFRRGIFDHAMSLQIGTPGHSVKPIINNGKSSSVG